MWGNLYPLRWTAQVDPDYISGMTWKVGTGATRRNIRNIHPLVEALHQRRLERGISLHKLARKTGYDVFTLGAWERGKYSPSLLRFNDVADALGLKIVLQSK